MIDLATDRTTGSVRERIEGLMSAHPAAEACAVIEHAYGVLPLLDTFFDAATRQAISASCELGSLGFFTPEPELGWGAAVDGEPAGGGVALRGEVRLPSPASDGSIVLVRLADARHRLAWIEHRAHGVERCGSRSGGPASTPCWLHIEGAEIGEDFLSRAVTLAPGTDLFRCLANYASVWALAAALAAHEGVRALRRAARTTKFRGGSFSGWQPLALGLAEAEIEAELAAASAFRYHALTPEERDEDDAQALAVALGAARALDVVVLRTAELVDSFGLEVGGPLAGDLGRRSLTVFLGGAPQLEIELARVLDARELAGREEKR